MNPQCQYRVVGLLRLGRPEPAAFALHESPIRDYDEARALAERVRGSTVWHGARILVVDARSHATLRTEDFLRG